MKLAAFLLEVRRRARNINVDRETRASAKDAALQFVAYQRDTPEAQLLARVVTAIDNCGGEFTETDIYALSPRALALVASMMDAAISEP